MKEEIGEPDSDYSERMNQKSDTPPIHSDPAGELFKGNIHVLKTWQPYFAGIKYGLKTFDVRKHDRDFNVGDILRLEEFDSKTMTRTGNTCDAGIRFILPGGQFGIEAGYDVLGIKIVEPSTPQTGRIYTEGEMKDFAARCVLYYSHPSNPTKTIQGHLNDFNCKP